MTYSNYLENAFLNKVFRNTNFTVSAVYIKLHIGDPGEDCTGAPATDTNRKQAVFGTPAAAGVISNTNIITWTSLVGTETISHVSAWDALSGGNPLGSGALGTPRSVTAGDNLNINAGDLDCLMD